MTSELMPIGLALEGRGREVVDEVIAILAFRAALDQLEELKAAPRPLPVGLATRFKHRIPKRPMDSIYEQETSHYWHAYAAVMQEYIEVFEAAPKLEFVAKRGKR